MQTSTNMHRFGHEAMTTTFEAVIVHPDATYAGQAAKAVFAEISRIERLLSRYDPGTDLAQANRLRPGQFMAVNLEIVECLVIAARAYDSTGGAFDIAYRSRNGGSRPSAMDFLLLSQPDAAGEDATEADPAVNQYLVGLAPDSAEYGFGQNMEIPLDARTLEPNKSVDPTPPDGLNLDLGGIGKGYALDKAQVILDDWGIDNALLNAGTSTVLARGKGPDESGWTVGVSGDYGAETGHDRIVLRGQALSGSGTAIKGQHIRMPGSAEAAGAIAAWALELSAAWTDAVSTAAMVLPREQTVRFHQENPGTGVIVVYPDAPPMVLGPW